ncbi:MAG: hypothetical protein ACFFD2_26035, partial [Promethearchaeota archaeon]
MSILYRNNKGKQKLNRDGKKYITREFVSTFFFLVILLVSSGFFGWINAWVSFGLILIYQISTIFILHKINPSLINKRGKVIQETTKLFDKIFVVIFLPLAYSIPLLAGFDAIRFHWSYMHFTLNIMGGILFVLASIFGSWAMVVNSNFEMTVFIRDKEHQVCTSGPYKF